VLWIAKCDEIIFYQTLNQGPAILNR